MAQAQAFAAMQGVWGAPAPGFNPNAPAFNPAFNNRGPGGPQQQQKFQKPAPAPVAIVLPSKPTDEQICKHGVDCTKPACAFSHPSPVATKESGLVLSSEACEKQLKCEDPVRFGSFLQCVHAPSLTISSLLGLLKIPRLARSEECSRLRHFHQRCRADHLRSPSRCARTSRRRPHCHPRRWREGLQVWRCVHEEGLCLLAPLGWAGRCWCERRDGAVQVGSWMHEGYVRFSTLR